MTTDASTPKTNLNTWLSMAGFALAILAGSVALGRFQGKIAMMYSTPLSRQK